MHVLILGKGFLGTRIHKYLNNHDGTSSEIYSRKELDYNHFPTLYNKMQSITSSQPNYDVVINASGYTGIPNIDAAEDNREACWNCNVTTPLNIYDACLNRQIPMIQISSGCIYSGYDKEYTELDTPNFGMFNSESSFYSKTKHVAEMMLHEPVPMLGWLFRIRMPFCGENIPRNYFTKILGYDDLITMRNSVTGVGDFCHFIYKFIRGKYPTGAYNVVNEGSIDARNIVKIMEKHGLVNPNHRFIPVELLQTKAKRSNCILSTDKIKVLGLQLPSVRESVEKAVKQLAEVRK